MDLHERIKAALVHAELRPVDLGRRMGRKPQFITKHLRREAKSMRAETAYAIATHCKVSLSWLISGEGPMLGPESLPDGWTTLAGIFERIPESKRAELISYADWLESRTDSPGGIGRI